MVRPAIAAAHYVPDADWQDVSWFCGAPGPDLNPPTTRSSQPRLHELYTDIAYFNRALHTLHHVWSQYFDWFLPARFRSGCATGSSTMPHKREPALRI